MRGTTLAARSTVPSTISALECVEALCLAGFRVRSRSAGRTVLVRRDRMIVVPDVLVLSDGLLDSILTDADMSSERLLWLLGEVSTETEIAFE